MTIELIQKFFSNLSSDKIEKLNALKKLIEEWNEKINLVSRKNIDKLEEQHFLPSLAISKFCKFAPGAQVIDVGTGGGFPGLPLAIVFPEAKFTLVDSIAKKINVVREVAQELELPNVSTLVARVESHHKKYDFVLGRAVTALPGFIGLTKHLLKKGNPSSLENGILYLKGGDFLEEIKELPVKPNEIFPLGQLFNAEYCEDKSLVYFSEKNLAKLKL